MLCRPRQGHPVRPCAHAQLLDARAAPGRVRALPSLGSERVSSARAMSEAHTRRSDASLRRGEGASGRRCTRGVLSQRLGSLARNEGFGPRADGNGIRFARRMFWTIVRSNNPKIGRNQALAKGVASRPTNAHLLRGVPPHPAACGHGTCAMRCSGSARGRSRGAAAAARRGGSHDGRLFSAASKHLLRAPQAPVCACSPQWQRRALPRPRWGVGASMTPSQHARNTRRRRALGRAGVQQSKGS